MNKDKSDKFFEELIDPENEETKIIKNELRKINNKMRTEYKEGDLLTKEDIGLVFKSRDEKQWKISCINNEFGVIIINKNQDNWYHVSTIGRADGMGYNNDCDIVSFIGPDFTEDKKLRIFEFEGYLGEHLAAPYEHNCIQVALGHFTTTIHNNLEILGSALANTTYSKISKWKITMEELLND